MTLFEYVSNITNGGTRVIVPKYLGVEQRERVGDKDNNITKVMWTEEPTKKERRDVKEDTRTQMKKVESILYNVSLAAFNSIDSEQFYRKCFAYAPLDVRTGKYERKKWDVLLMDIVTEIANRLTEVAFKTLNQRGCKNVLDMLNARVASWQKKANVMLEKGIEEDDLKVTINIH